MAARQLAQHQTQQVVQALLRVAEEDNGHEVVGFAAGESIAEILISRGEVYEAPLFLFDTAMGEGFDITVALHQRRDSQ